MNSKKFGGAAVALAMLVSVSAVAAGPGSGGDAKAERPGVMMLSDEVAVATVEAIDKKNRVVTLRREDGSLTVLAVSEEARNLEQVEVGDRVVVQHTIGLIMMLSAEGAGVPARVDTLEVARTEPGQRPGGIIIETVEATGTVIGVDKKARTVTLEGVERTITLPVADDIDLSNVQVGDRVDAVFQESIAISVEPAPRSD